MFQAGHLKVSEIHPESILKSKSEFGPEIMHNLFILDNVIYLMGFINLLMKNFISIFEERRTRMQLWNLSCEVCREESGPWILVESLGGAQLWWSEHCWRASPLLWSSILLIKEGITYPLMVVKNYSVTKSTEALTAGLLWCVIMHIM